MRKREIELLAPARNVDFGIAAINCGADAVYIGIDGFSARQAAGSDINGIEELVKYAHQFYVKVYVALNIILFNNELKKIQKIIRNLYNIGVDAIIIQDLAILEMDLPPIAIHASTQMNNFKLEKIMFYDKLGLNRVILARELSLKELKLIRSKVKIELEVFIHGALCVSMSGQCYLSSYYSKRSANRGTCSQPCRMLYKVVNEKGQEVLPYSYLLSLKDLNLSVQLDDLIRLGINSFKIEGRLKDINYLKNVTSFYRKKIDNFINKNIDYKRSSSGTTLFSFNPDFERIFNRGYTDFFIEKRKPGIGSWHTPKFKGLYMGKVLKLGKDNFKIKYHNNKNVFNNGDGFSFFNKKGKLIGKRVNIVNKELIFPDSMSDIISGIRIYRNKDHQFYKSIKNNYARRVVSVFIELKDNEKGYHVSFCDEDSNKGFLEINCKKIKAKKEKTSIESIIKQFNKTGNSLFAIKEIKIKFSNDYFIPVKDLNKIRRDLFEKVLQIRQENYFRKKSSLKKIQNIYMEESIDYNYNVANKLAEKFYKKLGIKKIEPAYEIKKRKNVKLMRTKYCLKYEAGLCQKNKNIKQENNHHELFLIDIKGNRFKLNFDCKKCFMEIIGL